MDSGLGGSDLGNSDTAESDSVDNGMGELSEETVADQETVNEWWVDIQSYEDFWTIDFESEESEVVEDHTPSTDSNGLQNVYLEYAQPEPMEHAPPVRAEPPRELPPEAEIWHAKQIEKRRAFEPNRAEMNMSFEGRNRKKGFWFTFWSGLLGRDPW